MINLDKVKKVYFLFLFVFPLIVFSQASKYHYIPPLTSAEGNADDMSAQWIYITTPSTDTVNWTIWPLPISNATSIVDSDMNLIFNLNFNVDEVDELQDSTNTTNIRYSTDSLLLLDDNKRVFKDTEDITDTIEKDIRRQAF